MSAKSFLQKYICISTISTISPDNFHNFCDFYNFYNFSWSTILLIYNFSWSTISTIPTTYTIFVLDTINWYWYPQYALLIWLSMINLFILVFPQGYDYHAGYRIKIKLICRWIKDWDQIFTIKECPSWSLSFNKKKSTLKFKIMSSFQLNRLKWLKIETETCSANSILGIFLNPIQELGNPCVYSRIV